SSPLATTVFDNRLFTFLPISQLDPAQYSIAVSHADEASKAASFTIIARAIGITKNVAKLKGVPIDRYFWDDAAQKARWTGPVTQHASLGPVTAIAAAEPIAQGNIIGPIKARRAVLIRGTFDESGGGTGTHWMLATSFI